ncbi:MAG: hypothetical protein L3J74_08415 [Bacteroidales bacterium]|nr:hypothetical protein [Bacteroidales bacterium]
MKLIFEIKGDERRWEVLLKDFMGEDLFQQAHVEYDATAKNHQARVQFLDYKKNQALINKLRQSDNIISAYLIDNKKIIETVK